jgi:hypothetical protein
MGDPSQLAILESLRSTPSIWNTSNPRSKLARKRKARITPGLRFESGPGYAYLLGIRDASTIV